MAQDRRSEWDAIIVGGGPAGLSAALVLGRCRRRVLVLDGGRPRNAVSPALHGFLTRDGIEPSELLRLGREQLAAYPGVESLAMEAASARRSGSHFVVTLADGSTCRARKLLFATGVTDRLPDIEGAAALYGKGVFHCPYCDGWEARGLPMAVYAQGCAGSGLARTLLGWTADLVLCTDGPAAFPAEERRRLSRLGIGVREERLARLEGNGRLERLVFAHGPALPCAALFFNTGQAQGSSLPTGLGCEIGEDGAPATDDHGQTTVPGAYLAGDARHEAQLAIVAAGQGAAVAVAISKALLGDEFGEPARPLHRMDRPARNGRRSMSDTKGQHTNEREANTTEEKKDEGQGEKAHAGASGPGTDNTSAGSGGRGGHRKRKGGKPDGEASR
ncbi:MAG: NAD(P)/FAD-dependent oxidoreductase [Gemmataceae bacterium]|nr:NAD(P)/FAD-dependent oxidoreductase [Gemmataceae bacterium]